MTSPDTAPRTRLRRPLQRHLAGSQALAGSSSSSLGCPSVGYGRCHPGASAQSLSPPVPALSRSDAEGPRTVNATNNTPHMCPPYLRIEVDRTTSPGEVQCPNAEWPAPPARTCLRRPVDAGAGEPRDDRSAPRRDRRLRSRQRLSTCPTTRRRSHSCFRRCATSRKNCADLDPRQVHEWYLAVCADAYNGSSCPTPSVSPVRGRRISRLQAVCRRAATTSTRCRNSCGGCRCDVKKRTGDDACPFNALYWDFLDRSEDKLGRNPRMAQIDATWRRMPDADRQAVRHSARTFLASLTPWEP